MNRMHCWIVSVLLVACGDTPGPGPGDAGGAPGLTGTWIGAAIRTDVQSGRFVFPQEPRDELVIRDNGPGKLTLEGFCPLDVTAAPPATITSPTTFTFDAYSCPDFYIGQPGAPDPCAISLTIDHAEGHLNGNALTITASGQFTGCEARYDMSFFESYTGARSSTP